MCRLVYIVFGCVCLDWFISCLGVCLDWNISYLDVCVDWFMLYLGVCVDWFVLYLGVCVDWFIKDVSIWVLLESVGIVAMGNGSTKYPSQFKTIREVKVKI